MLQTRQLAAIMFTDIVGYTALMGEDEQRAFDILQQNRKLQKPIIEKYNGRWIKEIGDGVMASFNTVSNAIYAAEEIQQQCKSSGEYSLRIGIHQGEIVFDGDDVFGDAVNIASRIQAIAPVGGIYVSESVHLNVVNKKNIQTDFVKAERLKNVKEHVKVYQVRLTGVQSSRSFPAKRITSSFKGRYTAAPKFVIAAIISIIITVAGYFVYSSFRSFSNITATDKSIAVLPFINRSGDKEQEYFSDGLTEEVINLLTKIEGLKVIARTSSFAFKGKNEDIRIIGEKLSVAHILQGSVQKEGNRIRINAQLIKASDGSPMWSDRYDKNIQSLFDLQDEIAQSVVKELRIKLLNDYKKPLPPPNPQSYSLTLQGNYFFDKLDKENVAKAIDLYLKALAIDSTDARAWASIANAYARQGWQKYEDKTKSYQKARYAAKKAISIDPNLSSGHSESGDVKMYHDMDWKGAEEAYKVAISLDPGNAALLNSCGNLFLILGHHSKAIEFSQKAVALDPLRPLVYLYHGTNLMYAKRLKEAESAFKKALEINPQFQRMHMYLGRIYLMQGKNEAALNEMQQETNSTFKSFGLALAYHALGKKKEAHSELQSFINAYQKDWKYLIAEIYSFRGEREKAIEWLSKAYDENDNWLIWNKNNPLFENIQQDHRFQNILRKLNLSE